MKGEPRAVWHGHVLTGRYGDAHQGQPLAVVELNRPQWYCTVLNLDADREDTVFGSTTLWP